MSNQFRTILKTDSQNSTGMKTKNLFTVAAISAGLALGVTDKRRKKNTKNKPSTVLMFRPPCSKLLKPRQRAEQSSAGRRRAPTYEAGFKKNGKQIGVEMDANGKVLSKHNEAKEHKEKGEKY